MTEILYWFDKNFRPVWKSQARYCIEQHGETLILKAPNKKGAWKDKMQGTFAAVAEYVMAETGKTLVLRHGEDIKADYYNLQGQKEDHETAIYKLKNMGNYIAAHVRTQNDGWKPFMTGSKTRVTDAMVEMTRSAEIMPDENDRNRRFVRLSTGLTFSERMTDGRYRFEKLEDSFPEKAKPAPHDTRFYDADQKQLPNTNGCQFIVKYDADKSQDAGHEIYDVYIYDNGQQKFICAVPEKHVVPLMEGYRQRDTKYYDENRNEVQSVFSAMARYQVLIPDVMARLGVRQELGGKWVTFFGTPQEMLLKLDEELPNGAKTYSKRRSEHDYRYVSAALKKNVKADEAAWRLWYKPDDTVTIEAHDKNNPNRWYPVQEGVRREDVQARLEALTEQISISMTREIMSNKQLSAGLNAGADAADDAVPVPEPEDAGEIIDELPAEIPMELPAEDRAEEPAPDGDDDDYVIDMPDQHETNIVRTIYAKCRNGFGGSIQDLATYLFICICRNRKLKALPVINTRLADGFNQPIYVLDTGDRSLPPNLAHASLVETVQEVRNRFPDVNIQTMPEPIQWSTNPADYIWNPTIPITNITIPVFEHIVKDRSDRFPEELHGIEDIALFESMQDSLRRSAIIANRDISYALPSYSRKYDEVSMLLPLRIPTINRNKPIAAMLLRKNLLGYQLATVLTLDMARRSVRLFRDPETTWLKKEVN